MSPDNYEIPWWDSPQIKWGVAGLAGGIFAILTGLHIVIPYSAMDLGLIIGGALSAGGAGFAIYRRIRAGNDPHNDAPRVTLTKP